VGVASRNLKREHVRALGSESPPLSGAVNSGAGLGPGWSGEEAAFNRSRSVPARVSAPFFSHLARASTYPRFTVLVVLDIEHLSRMGTRHAGFMSADKNSAGG
jgi:hypothetical protein